MPVTRISGIHSPRRPDLLDPAHLSRMAATMSGGSMPLRQVADTARGFALALSAHPRMRERADVNWHAGADVAVALDGNVLAPVPGAAGVLHAIRNGDSPEVLDGDFAFAAWDGAPGRLVLALDPLGKKPLYYHHDASTGLIVFASEARGVLAHPLVRRAPSIEGLSLFLRDGHILAPFTAFEGIRKLRIGEALTFGADGSRSGGVYWRIEDCTDESRSQQEWQEELRQRLIADQRKNLLGRHRAAVFLGAGLDSTAILGMLARGAGVETMSVTAAFEAGSRKSEGDGDFARRVAEEYGVQHEAVTVSTETVRSELADCYRQMDEPYVPVGNVISGALMLERIAAHGIDVAFSGVSDGEIFGLSSIARAGRRRADGEDLSDDDIRAILHQPAFIGGKRQAKILGTDPALADALHDEVLRPYRENSKLTNLHDELNATVKLVDHHGEGTQFIERMAALKGTEVRLAMQDWETVRFSFQIPARFKGYPDPETHRLLLREGFADYIPGFVLQRSKSGLPGYNISDHDFDRLSGELFSEQRIRGSGLFDPAEFSRYAKKKKQGRKQLALLMLWLDLHIYGDESILELL